MGSCSVRPRGGSSRPTSSKVSRAPDAGEPSDYVGAELEFLFFLGRHELAARSTGDTAALEVVIDRERTFVLSHVVRWLPSSSHKSARPNPAASLGPQRICCAPSCGMT